MKFLAFKDHFEPFKIFSVHDILKYDPEFDSRRLIEWQQKKYLQKIINRWYIFNREINLDMLYLISNRIYSPSYISFESTLSHYNLIPEGVFTVTAATSLKTQSFNTGIAQFIYRHIKPELMFGYNLLDVEGQFFKMASPEKALLDYFYLKTDVKSQADLKALRLNESIIQTLISNRTLFHYLALMKNKLLEKRIMLLCKTYPIDA